MYAGRVACCHLVTHVEYAPRAILRLEKDGTDGWTDARPMHYAYPLDVASMKRALSVLKAHHCVEAYSWH